LLLLVAADAAAEQHGTTLRARLDRGLEHRTAPSLAHDAHDQTCVQHFSYSFAGFLSRIRTPSSITGMIGAKAINAPMPRPVTMGSRPPIAAEAPKANARRKVFANGPVATPLASTAIPTKS